MYSIEEALSRLQVRPLLEALRQAVSYANIDIFARLSHEIEISVDQISEKTSPVQVDRHPPLQKQVETPDVATVEKAEATGTAKVDSRLSDFVDHAYLFRDRVVELSELNGGSSPHRVEGFETASPANDRESKTAAEEQKPDACSLLAAAALHLPMLVSAFPESLRLAANAVLPSSDPRLSPTQNWAPVMAWLVFQSLPPSFSPLEVFESVNLRWALAETFSSVGLEGETAWKAAAQVRVLLKFTGDEDSRKILRTEEFWKDPDVRWLTGVNLASGIEYMNKERFEELLCWFELPALVGIAASAPLLAGGRGSDHVRSKGPDRSAPAERL